MRNYKPSIIVMRVLAVIAVTLVYLYVEYAEYRSTLANQKLVVTEQLAVVKSDVEARLQKNIELVKGLATYVSLNPSLSQQEYAFYAKELLTYESNIRVLAASDAYIVTHLYPIEGNEKVFGMDYRNLQDQLPSVQLAIKTQKAVVSGPVDLVQGGKGLIVRLPMIIDDKNWGIISVVIDYDSFINDLGLNERENLNIAIRGKHSLGMQGDVFYGASSLFDDPFALIDVTLPYGSWIIATEPVSGRAELTLHWQYFLSALTVLAFILYNLQLRLRNEDLAVQSRRSLKASEQKFRNFFNLNNAVMLIVDEDGGVIDANEAAQSFYQCDHAELLDLSLPDLRKTSDIQTQNILSSHLSASIYSEQHVLKDDSMREVEVFSTPIELEGQKQISLIVTDVTDKRQHEQKWKLYEQVFIHAQEGMFITDPSFNIIAVNPAFEAITGVKKSSVLNHTPAVFNSSKHTETFYKKLFAQLKENGFWRGELWFPSGSHAFQPQLLSMTAVRDIHGKVTNYVAVFLDISQQKLAEAQLERLAHYDGLTGLPNRMMLKHQLEKVADYARVHATKCALMFLDLDRFKVINDSLGHEAGDELLNIVSQRFRNVIHEYDILARLGGDEFVVLVEEYHDETELLNRAQSLCKVVQMPFKIADELEVNIGLSIGISQLPKDTSSTSELLKFADAAMYKAKKSKKHDVVFYSPEISEDAGALLTISTELKQAKAKDQFEMLLQPQIDLNTGNAISVEALIRWHHPQRGFLTPDKFVSLAESTGSIRFITEWVFDKAILLIEQWRQKGIALTISVNVSAIELSNRKLFNRISQAIKHDPSLANFITIEIVESAIVENIEFAKTLLSDLREMGFKIAIDDFGIGFSSLSYLSQLSVDILKIDRAFVSKMECDKELSIVKSIIDLAHNFNLSVTAEGIEVQEHVNLLKRLGCKVGQGYLYSKPIPVEVFESQFLFNRQQTNEERG